MHTMGKFLLELCLPDYSMLEFHPSLLAAAALYLSIKIYHCGEWVRNSRDTNTCTTDDKFHH